MNSEEARLRLRMLARSETQRPARLRSSLTARLRRPRKSLRAAHARFAAGAAQGAETAKAAEWLLDNYYIVERAFRLIEEDFTAEFERRLPRPAAGESEAPPLAYSVAGEIAAACDYLLDLTTVAQLVEEFQALRPLTIAEVWALPILLRVTLLERLAAALESLGEAKVVQVPGERPNNSRSDPQAAADRIAASCIRSLRTLEAADWKEFFEHVNHCERILRDDPAGVYARMDFATRDRYRKVVEELSLCGEWTEWDVAKQAIELARRAPAGRPAHVGYHLIDEGFAVLAARVGYRPPLSERWRRSARAHPTLLYLGGIAAVATAHTLLLCAVLLWLAAAPATIAAATLLALIPITTVAIATINSIVTRSLPPSSIPKMDFRDGVPAECRTLLVVPAIVNRGEDVAALLERMEIHWLSGIDSAHVALLTDFADAPAESMPQDGELLASLREGVERLNRAHGDGDSGPFHLLHRRRRWNPAEGCWMGWERKRGKLVELNRLLGNDVDTSFALHVGDPAVLASVRYVITLDADTHVPREAALRLIAAIAHPLNRAELDPASGRVRAGYTILQPRVEVAPQSVESSRFARLFAGDAGVDLYARNISDAYQDLFGEGIYVGKGIYDVRAFARSLAERVPENSILSHDLFEGLHGRVGLVTDVVFLEHFPGDYLSYAKRLHRWVRGDWQLLPWLGRHVPGEHDRRLPNRFSLIAWWKIADNLRRTLLAPSLLAFLFLAWLWLPGATAVWTLLAVLVLAAPALSEAMGGFLAAGGQQGFSPALLSAASTLRPAAGLWALNVAFLPHRAAVIADAIGRTFHRLFISRRFLLQWVSAAESMRDSDDGLSRRAAWRAMAAAPLVASAAAALVAVVRPAALTAALPLLALWLLSPEIALRISRPRVRVPPSLTAEERARLRRLARRTWAFFDTFAGPDNQWLAPDHFQESPRGEQARRTSPTNIGMQLLATIAAHDFGFTGVVATVLRLRNTMDTLERMERHDGHFYNWYDTRDLTPLEPRYLSTVDSGNLAGCLLTVTQYCGELAAAPILSRRRWQGLLDTLGVLDELIQSGLAGRKDAWVAQLQTCMDTIRRRARAAAEEPSAWARAMDELAAAGCAELDAAILAIVHSGGGDLDAAVLAELRTWVTSLHEQLQGMRRETDLCLPWAFELANPPEFLHGGEPAAALVRLQRVLTASSTLRRLGELGTHAAPHLAALDGQLAAAGAAANDARAWLERLEESLARGQEAVRGLLQAVEHVAETAARRFDETDFATLYDPRRRLFFLGYNVTANAMDEHHYDLLASEARLASFLAIAKGDVPYEHWLHLGRPLGRAGGANVLLSWSATMFEYLMPPLLLREGEHTILGQSCDAAVRLQIDYARRRGAPWGISESGYYLFDRQQNYQYRAFGLPDLGFKRGLEDDLVVAPYASLLALRYAPRQVLANLDTLEKEGMSGRYGLYEAVDFTAARLLTGAPFAVVRSFMAHHQGMILAALDNFLNDDALVRRFHAAPEVHTAEMLLHERLPIGVPPERSRPRAPALAVAPRRPTTIEPWRVPLDSPVAQALALSNGRYHLLVTDGGSAARWRDLALTRWSADPTRDADGWRVHLRDGDSNAAWTLHSPAGERHLNFQSHMVERVQRAHDLAISERIVVAPDADIEIHLLNLTNEGRAPRHLTLTSWAEVALGDAVEDRRHPAFSKLFVQGEYLRDLHALVFHRRPRAGRAPTAWMVHALVLPEGQALPSGYEMDRARLLGRASPASLTPHTRPPDAAAAQAPLDPVMALSADLAIQAHGSLTLAYLCLAAPSRAAALDLLRRHRSLSDLEWQIELARRRSDTRLARLALDAPAFHGLQRVLSLLVYPHRALRAAADVLSANHAGQSSLWRHGISGDHPILLLRVRDLEDTALLQVLLRGHRTWHEDGVTVDFVLLNERPSAYADAIDARLARAFSSENASAWLQQPGGVFVVRDDQLTPAERSVLLAAARVVLRADGGDLLAQTAHIAEPAGTLPPLAPAAAGPVASESLPRAAGLLHDNGLGGFSADGREYVIHLEPGAATPAPWVNVIANPTFGAIVSESGGGCVWAENSGENRLTPWRNDPLDDPPGDVVYLRDEETGNVWTPTPRPAPDRQAYECRHGAGYSLFRHTSQGLDQEVRKFVAWSDPLQIVTLRLSNRLDRTRRITATYYVEWVLGRTRDAAAMFVIPEFDAPSETLLARNPWNEDFASRVAFVAASERLHGLTGDRAEFLGRHGDYARPAALERIGLASSIAPGLDPCAALQVHVDLAAGATADLHFLLGQASDRAAALALVRRYRDRSAVDNALAELHESWDATLGAVTVETPSPELNVMVNRWLLYQTISCRLWGRSSQYQSSGAFGFRDQLQDVLALVHARPELCRTHILEAARHQFEEGDVLHWWHPPAGAGVRTRCSDDLLWLPFATAHYIAASGDEKILDERLPFLAGAPLASEESERYARFQAGEHEATLYDHCCAAMRRGSGTGAHGLPLFGAGDWNDGMNRVGALGRGESVWLGWFLHATLRRFAPLCERRGDRERAADFLAQAKKLRDALEASAWDGEWYRRGYYDDGHPLGSAQGTECRIDSIAQSWAVLAAAAAPQRARQAMESACRLLCDGDHRLIRLLAPPFSGAGESPGYIAAYPPGVRENGGQYTHAAIWVVWALAALGDGDRAMELFENLLPLAHARTPEEVARYRVEPYVLAGDVYAVEPYTGRGGWTWYTGAAGWAYRLAVEGLLGLQREPDGWRLDPCLPRHWPGFAMTLRDGATTYRIQVDNPERIHRGEARLSLDGEPVEGNHLARSDDGKIHEVSVRLHKLA